MHLPKASILKATYTDELKIHTIISPPEMFANTSHIIELPTQLLIVDGQYFAQYAAELRAYADTLLKPITRFYISHDHPDHYIGFGDAFPDVPVYALREIGAIIRNEGSAVLEERRAKFGQLIAAKLNLPTHDVAPGSEIIDGVKFNFERATGHESPLSLVIKIPSVGVAIVQDIVYHDVHLFISGPTTQWRETLLALKGEAEYITILPGHGMPGPRTLIDQTLSYLDTVDGILAHTKTAGEYKAKLLKSYPYHGGAGLIDIYLPILFPV